MSLLQLLQEASSLPLADLKKAVQKDKRAAPILKKDLKLDDIEDKAAFLDSVKFHILNNQNVRAFFDKRNQVKDVDKRDLERFRKLRAADLTQDLLNQLRDTVADLFREHSYVERGGMSKDLKKELDEWFNSNGRFFNLPAWAQRELDSLDVKPKKRTLVYRGLLFSKSSLEERETYDGTLEVGSGLKFLRSIRKGERIVDLSWDRPSSWTTRKEIAERFAKYGPASSNFSATMNWLTREMDKRAIDGALGFIVSTFAKPEDVLLDTSLFNARFHMQHGDEGELILKPGTYTCRIVKKYTVEGEVDLDAETSEVDLTPISKAIERLKELEKQITLPEGLEELKGSHWAVYDVRNLLGDYDQLKRLMLNSTTTQALHAYDAAVAAYKELTKELPPELLKPELHAHDTAQLKRVKKLLAVLEPFTEKVTHSKFSKEKDGRPTKGPKHELSAEEYRTTLNPLDLPHLERPLLTGRKVSERSGGDLISALAKSLGVELPSSAPVHAFGETKQAQMLDAITAAFFKKLGIEPKDDRQENIKLLITLLKKAYRNFKLIERLADLKKNIKELDSE